jgi:hypothetical protein
MKTWVMTNRHLPIAVQGNYLKRALQGFSNYFGVPGNTGTLDAVREPGLQGLVSGTTPSQSKGGSTELVQNAIHHPAVDTLTAYRSPVSQSTPERLDRRRSRMR